MFKRAHDPESVTENYIVFAPRGVYDVAPLGLTLTSRLSTIAALGFPNVMDKLLINDSEYC